MSNVMMAREIEAQAGILPEVVALLRAAIAHLEIRPARVVAGGCGDSLFAAGAVAGRFLEVGVDYRAASAMEIAHYLPLGAGDLVVPISVSGGTRRTVVAARRAVEAGAAVLAVTCNPESALAGAATRLLVLPFRPLSRSMPHTLDYTVTLVALAVLADALAGAREAALDAVGAIIEGALQADPGPIERTAARIGPATKVIFLGAGPGLATAAYGAAKLHEAGGLAAFPAELENFAHGLNFVLEPDDVVVLLATDDVASERVEVLTPGLAELGIHVLVLGRADVPTGPQILGGRTALPPGWAGQLRAAILIQRLCLATVEANRLDLALPRAGRSRGDRYLALQRSWMS